MQTIILPHKTVFVPTHIAHIPLHVHSRAVHDITVTAYLYNAQYTIYVPIYTGINEWANTDSLFQSHIRRTDCACCM